MAPRWKGKAAEAKALAEPMSVVVSQLQSSLIENNSQGLLTGCAVLLDAHPEQTELLVRACFGSPIITAEKEKQRFQLTLEEALYLSSVLKCLKLVGANNSAKNDEELWDYMIKANMKKDKKKDDFPILFKAYSHLRKKNWVVKEGSKFGVDFVAYRHHPSLVHAEYSVLALPDEDGNPHARLKVWSDYHCTLRLCRNVAKTLLVLHVSKNGHGTLSPSSLEHYSVDERIITKWDPEVNRENQTKVVKKSCKLSFSKTARDDDVVS